MRRCRRVEQVVDVQAGREYVQLVDPETGEVLERYWRERRAKLSGRPVGGRAPDFLRLYRTNWRHIVQTRAFRKLTPYDLGFFFMLAAYVGWETPWLVDAKAGRNLSETDIADLFEMDRAHVYRVLRRLCDAGLISLSNNGAGRPMGVRLNPHLIHYGKRVKDLADVAEFEKSAWQPPVRVRYRQRSSDG